jgi:hypothetical protein
MLEYLAAGAPEAQRLVCYPTVETPPVLRPGPTKRRWMNETPARFAYRCLPLVIANSHGWELLVDRSFTATWSGGAAAAEIQVSSREEVASSLAASHFGNGVLTFQTGYLFATEPSHSLWIMGPVNSPKDGITPLCGVVETDWIPYTFTMNWLFTCPGTVCFERGEPFCHFFPVPRQYLSAFEPEIRDLQEVPEKARILTSWRTSRAEAIARMSKRSANTADQGWDKHYFKGQSPGGEIVAENHVTRLVVRPFKDLTSVQVSRHHGTAESAATAEAGGEAPEAAHEPRETADAAGRRHVADATAAREARPAGDRLVQAHFLCDGSRQPALAFPDPLVSARIPGQEGLDQVLQRAVLPFWSELRLEGEAAHRCYLWLRRRREHLEVHVHGPADRASEIGRRLEAAVTAGLPRATPRWPVYRRQDALGPGAALRDDRYAGLLTACLARGCDLVLASLPADGTPITHGCRRIPLLRGLAAGPAAVALPPAARLAYLAFHRTSALRENLDLGPDGAGLQQAINLLDRRAEEFGATLQGLRQLLAGAGTGNGDAEPPASPELGAWQAAVRDLHVHFARRLLDAAHPGEPRSECPPAFGPLFAACHGIADQAGINAADEAFWCHLMARAGSRHEEEEAP